MNIRNKSRYFIFVLSLIIGIHASLFAQDKKDEKPEKDKPKFQKYEEVIPDSAITKTGLFITHEVDGKLYYEITEKQLGEELLWLVQFAKTQTSFGYGGTEVIRRVVRWERLQDHILLRNVEYELRADENTPEAIAVEASSVEEIIKSFKILTFGENKSPVIEVTSLFKEDTHEFSPKEALDAAGIDKDRTFITSVKTFPQNIETRVLATFNLKPPKPDASNGRSRGRNSRHSDPSLGSVTVELHHSMIELPERPMLPRIFDKRIGFFDGSHQDYSSDRHQVEEIRYIRRWRLEKKNPDLKVSEPVKPIVYYVGRGIPEKWHKYLIEGVEWWQPVFENAGFKNAIMAKMAPTPEEDPDFDAEDVRYSTIRWLPSTIANAYGPHVQDPRTGEIIEADIRVFHNVISLIRDWYFVQASPSDKRAQKIPMPDEVIGACLRYVIAHEVGHTLGLRHNFKASYYYEVEKYRDPKFTQKYGLEASIMDYGRFNYIAQPGDGAATIPVIGPYDYFAIEWGYREFNGTKTPEDDIPHLNKIANRQVKEPMVRFNSGREIGPVGMADPHARAEDLGDDPVKATTYGLKNIECISKYIVQACGEKDKDYAMLKHMYDELLNQMYRELGQVAALVGGIEIDNWMYGQSADVFTPTPEKEQQAAVQYLLENGFKTQDYILRKDIITRLGMHNMAENISNRQKGLLYAMLDSTTVSRMLDIEATGFDNYKAAELIADLKSGLFEELTSGNVQADLFRRNLQRAFVEQLIKFISGKSAARNDLQAISRGTLMELQQAFQQQIDKNIAGIEHYHFVDLNETIKLALEGENN